MMEDIGDTSDNAPAGVDRRRLLKGAAAAGVGISAWAAPSITALGGTPVYAQVCTAPVNRYYFGYRNTSCNCEANDPLVGNKFINYNELSTSQCPAGAPLPPDYGVTLFVGTSGAPAEQGCAPGSNPQGSNDNNGTARVTFSIPEGVFCQTLIEVIVNNCQPDKTYVGNVEDTGGTSFFPLVPCGPGFGGNLFIRAGIQCSTDAFCLSAPGQV